MPNHLAGSALRTIQAHARREVAHWYIPLESREDAHGLLQRATGARVEFVDRQPTVVLDGRPCLDRRGDPLRDLLDGTWGRMIEWCSGPVDAPADLVPPTVPSGTTRILSGMGLTPPNALALARVLHSFSHETGDRSVSIHDGTRGRTTHYRRGPLDWRDGVVTIRLTTIPGVIAAALAGMTMDQVVDDPILAPMRIRLVPTTSRRDGVLQIITTDAGREIRPASTSKETA